MSDSKLEYPEHINREEIDPKTSANIDLLAENVRNPFPIEDLIKIGKLITDLQKRAETAENETVTDELTELPNRRWFNEQLKATTSEAQRRGLTFYLAFIDYDNFKAVNTSYGHTGGDAALRLMSGLSNREGEPISRYGGDEFAQIITPSSEQELVGLSQRYHQQIAKRESELREKITPIKGESPVSIGVSIGIARYQGETPEGLIKKASEAALEAKNKGKNTTVLARTLNGQTRFLELRPVVKQNVAQRVVA